MVDDHGSTVGGRQIRERRGSEGTWRRRDRGRVIVWHVRGTLEVHGRRLHGGFRGARGKVKRKKVVVITVVHV